MELATLCLDLGYKLADTASDLTRFQINFLMTALKMRAESAEIAERASEGVTRIVFGDG